MIEGERLFLKECKDHIHYCRNMDNHAWTNILIKELIDMVERKQDEKANKIEDISENNIAIDDYSY